MNAHYYALWSEVSSPFAMHYAKTFSNPIGIVHILIPEFPALEGSISAIWTLQTQTSLCRRG